MYVIGYHLPKYLVSYEIKISICYWVFFVFFSLWRFYSAVLHKALCPFPVFQVTSLTCRVAELEGLLDRGDRERNSLNTQLEEAFKKLTAQETDNSRVQRAHTRNSIMLSCFAAMSWSMHHPVFLI